MFARTITAIFTVMAGAFPGAAVADESAVADFYRGKTISMVMSSTAGGSYDLMARTIQRYLPQYIPGNPAIVVRNQPGAGGLAAVNALYHTAPRDGSVIAAIQGSVPFEPMLGTKEADFDPLKFSWLASPSSETCVMTIWGADTIKSVDDLRAREITMGSSGANSNPSFFARLINAVLRTRLRLVFGYPGQPDVFLAMEKGEVEGHPCVFWTALQATRAEWLRDRKVSLALQYGTTRESALGATPFLHDLVTDPDDRALVEVAQAPLALGRPYLAPPGVPQDRVGALRLAFQRVFDDSAFLAETEKLSLVVNSRLGGEAMADLISKSYSAPATTLQRLRDLSKQ